jgi:hypothetical protein
MAKFKVLAAALGILLVLGAAAAQASGVITLEVEILPGFRITGPGSVSFGSLHPGIPEERELQLQVWSNVPWQLFANYYGTVEAPGIVEVQGTNGTWIELGSSTNLVIWDQPKTDPDGVVIKVPLRFTGSFSHDPGTYDIQIEFAVVPLL